LQSIAEEREIRQQDAGSSLSPVSPSLSSPDFSSIDAQKEDA